MLKYSLVLLLLLGGSLGLSCFLWSVKKYREELILHHAELKPGQP
jgi:hypothetical protein